MNIDINQMLEVYFIAGTQNMEDGSTHSLLNVLERALESGISCFQFREKGEGSKANDREDLIKTAKACQKLCREYEVPFIVNDYVDLAIELQADGVHVGQKDQLIEEVLKKVDYNMIVGYSTNNKDQLLEAEKISDLDYLGIGPIYQTSTKKDHEEIIGIKELEKIMQEPVHKPVVAIGGITEQNVQDVKKTSVDGVAVISSILNSEDIKQTIKRLGYSST